MADAWLQKLRSSHKTCLVQDVVPNQLQNLNTPAGSIGPIPFILYGFVHYPVNGRRKAHFTMSDGMELAEEYDLKSGDLLVRKWRRKGTLGEVGKWDYEVGEQPHPLLNLDAEGLVESNVNPVFLRNDTKTHFQWRIRNLPYPIDNYVIKKSDDSQIILSTVNKKYYKKFSIPDLNRCSLPLEDKLEMAHANNTLIITYKKPQAILEMESTFERELKKMKASEDGDMDCTPS